MTIPALRPEAVLAWQPMAGGEDVAMSETPVKPGEPPLPARRHRPRRRSAVWWVTRWPLVLDLRIGDPQELLYAASALGGVAFQQTSSARPSASGQPQRFRRRLCDMPRG